ncbi:hypothetical protein SAMN05443287_101950 [Micromonospora phaseoli]|uniref:Right handed beta helix region n=1 Tax=Micromonospora phaseoli TaxID=1144548 RepID=A0A1H6TCM9_9ACTN|nr:hypothetical protein [Micromonospora phaseoli]PZW04196.1 hypothetical protein CLV64_101950 [Micromonospora phaseoli]SEI73995.1 hypothetical protein SAMN05443287_101950 [Micromonospora phaseoli]
MKPRHGNRRNRRLTVVGALAVLLATSGALAVNSYAASRQPPPPSASTPVPTPIPSPRPTSSPSLTSAPSPTSPPSPTPPPSASRGCALPGYPTAACTGVPAGWTPKVRHQGDLVITRAGTVLADHLVTGSILVKAENVVIRRTRLYGTVDNFVGDRIYGRMLIEDSEVVNPPGQQYSTNQLYAFGVANYTCRRCKVVNRMEGWRVGAKVYAGAGPVTIEDSYARLAVPPGMCRSVDPHGDGVQGYGGPTVVLRHNTIDQRLDDCPTAPIFVPDQDNDGGTIRDNLLAGGSYSLRASGGWFPAITGNKIVHDSYAYGPVDIDCRKVGTWSGNATVRYDWTAGRVLSEVKPLVRCG